MSDDNVRTLADTNRLEAFSDGVFAVAITLLALDLAVPHLNNGEHVTHLADALLDQWPVYLAYVLSFLTILVLWVNHHALFLLIRKTDHTFLLLNGALLLVVTTIPFGTSLLADYIQQPDRQIAQGVYGGLQFLMALLYNLMLVYATHNGRLLEAGENIQAAVRMRQQYVYGPFLLAVAFLLNFVNAEASLGLTVLLSLFFSLPASLTQRVFTRVPSNQKG